MTTTDRPTAAALAEGRDALEEARAHDDAVSWGCPDARLLLTVDAPRDTWDGQRLNGLGGSDAATILGLNPWHSPYELFLEKTGRGKPRPATSRMRWGQRLEAVLADWFFEETGVFVRRAGLMASRAHPIMRGNVDRLTADGGILECKRTNWRQAEQWEDGQVPDAAELQTQHYLAVTGRKHAWVVAMIDSDDPLLRRVERDEQIIADLTAAELAWWERHVVADAAPPVDPSQSCTDALNGRWQALAGSTVELPPSAIALRDEYHFHAAAAKDSERRKQQAANQLRDLFGEHTEAVVPGVGKVGTWRANGTFAAARFVEAEPDLAAAYQTSATVLDVDRLKVEQAAVYDRFRARVLRPAPLPKGA